MLLSSVAALTRATGIHSVPVDDPDAVELRLTGREPGIVDVAMLADYVLGAALRARVGVDRPLPTLTLTIELDAERLRPAVSARAWSEPGPVGLGRAHGILFSGSEQIGQCGATFAVPRRAASIPALPWEVAGVADFMTDGDRSTSAEMMLSSAMSVEDTTVVLQPDESMLNRSGQVQGGVLFRLAATTATPDARMVSGHLQFLSAAGPQAPISAHSSVLAATQRMLFVHTLIRQEERAVATGSFVHRKG